MRWDFLFIEVVSVILFLMGYFKLKALSSSRALEFLMIGVYGLILEALDMLIFKSYHYSSQFFLAVANVPICIALLWAVILAGSMEISDRLGLPKKIRPFMDALLAVWIDLALDAVAIRLEYWTWIIPLNEGWFGVPAGNLYAWMWVAFGYSIVARFIRDRIKQDPKWSKAYLAAPFIAYLILFVAMASVGILGELFNLVEEKQRLVVFVTQFFVFCIIVGKYWNQRTPKLKEGCRLWPLWKWSRFSMHIYFLIAYFVLGLHRSLPLLGGLAFFVFIVEIIFIRQFVENKT